MRQFGENLINFDGATYRGLARDVINDVTDGCRHIGGIFCAIRKYPIQHVHTTNLSCPATNPVSIAPSKAFIPYHTCHAYTKRQFQCRDKVGNNQSQKT
jgi:hypothetical protein